MRSSIKAHGAGAGLLTGVLTPDYCPRPLHRQGFRLAGIYRTRNAKPRIMKEGTSRAVPVSFLASPCSSRKSDKARTKARNEANETLGRNTHENVSLVQNEANGTLGKMGPEL